MDGNHPINEGGNNHIRQSIAAAERVIHEVEQTYFSDEEQSSSHTEWVSARSPTDTWRSTSISGIADWWSVASNGTTIDDWKSVDEDVPEEWHSDDSPEDELEQPLDVTEHESQPLVVSEEGGKTAQEQQMILPEAGAASAVTNVAQSAEKSSGLSKTEAVATISSALRQIPGLQAVGFDTQGEAREQYYDCRIGPIASESQNLSSAIEEKTVSVKKSSAQERKHTTENKETRKDIDRAETEKKSVSSTTVAFQEERVYSPKTAITFQPAKHSAVIKKTKAIGIQSQAVTTEAPEKKSEGGAMGKSIKSQSQTFAAAVDGTLKVTSEESLSATFGTVETQENIPASAEKVESKIEGDTAPCEIAESENLNTKTVESGELKQKIVMPAKIETLQQEFEVAEPIEMDSLSLERKIRAMPVGTPTEKDSKVASSTAPESSQMKTEKTFPAETDSAAIKQQTRIPTLATPKSQAVEQYSAFGSHPETQEIGLAPNVSQQIHPQMVVPLEEETLKSPGLAKIASASQLAEEQVSSTEVRMSEKEKGKQRTKDRIEISKVQYSKEITESHTTTRITYEQTFGSVHPPQPEPAKEPDMEAVVTSSDVRGPVTKEDSKQEPIAADSFYKKLEDSKEWIQLKIQEMHPAMTEIGSNFEEAVELHQQHEKVLEKLQTKQSPVEELLRQADELISTQKPRAEVYSAMAENLGLAWKDLNAQLEQRRQILEQAVSFFGRAKEFGDVLDRIQNNLTEGYFPDTTESCTAMLRRHQEERKAVLSSSMHTLNEGQQLSERLCEVATHSMGDSRPLHMQHAAKQTGAFVERYMESLHDRWRQLDALWSQRKIKLEQCLKRCQMLDELSQVQSWLRTKGAEYAKQKNLGDSSASSEILQHEHLKIESESKEIQDQALKLVRTAEQISHSDNYAAEELKAKAYEVLSECSDFLSVLESRRLLLSISVAFFNMAQTALNKLDQIEVQLTTSDIPRSGSSLISQHSQLVSAIEEISSPVIQEGHQLIERVGTHEPGCHGVARKVAELEDKRKHLLELCSAHQAENAEITSAFRNFFDKYEKLLNWIVNVGQAFLQRQRDMGTSHVSARSFVDQHESLQNDVRMKGIEVEALLSMVPSLVRVGGENAQDVHEKAENLREQWTQLRNLLEKRIGIAQRYFAFHKLASKLTKEMDDIESDVKKSVESSGDFNVRMLEEKLLSLQQEILQLNNSGRNFLEDARKVQDVYLNKEQAIATVEKILEQFQTRKFTLTTQWTNWQNQISTTKETRIQWENLLKDSYRIIKCTAELETKMFPVIPRDLNRVESIITFLENRMITLLPQIKSVQTDMENFLRKSESLRPKQDPEPEGIQMVKQLQEMHQALQKRVNNYQVVISMMISYFKNYEQLEKLVDMQESQFRITTLPNDASKIEVLIHEHESSKPTVMELFKYTNTEAEELIRKINEAEPPEAAAQDREKIVFLMELKEKNFEKFWDEHRKRLEQHLQFCIFNRDMEQIYKQIEDLNFQLCAMRDNYGESLPSAVATSEAFIQFEKTIEILQIRISHFVSTAEKMMQEHRVESSHVQQQIKNMQNKWSTFQTQVNQNRHMIDLAIDYFKLEEESEEWLKEGSRILIAVARKSTSCKSADDAGALHNEVQNFLRRGKDEQEERIRKISTLAMQLYGNRSHPSMQQVTKKNKDMLDSFTVISSELNTLTENLKTSAQEKIRERKEKEEMDAALQAAQAEAEAAKAAATAAQEAAKAAEAAAKAIPIVLAEKREVARAEEAVPIPSSPQMIQRQPPMLQPKPPVFIVPLIDAEVPEGTKFTFECRVDGFPVPQVQWFKDGILVQNNPDYQTTFADGMATLTIEETFSEDTARFTCKAVNSAGIAETHGQLTVKESRSPDGLIPPHFIKELVAATVEEGSVHQFDCQVAGNPLPLVSWFKNDLCVDNSTDYSITYNNGLCTLRIEEAGADHEGRYTCRAANQAGQVACSAKLQILSLIPSEGPVFTIPLSNVMARAGQKLRLECAVKGQPEPQLIWLHNSKPIKETRDIKLHFDGYKATLVITEAFPKDAGTYTVMAKNQAGEAMSTCNVSVKGRLPLETSDSEMASDIEPAKPQVKQHLDDQTTTEGSRVRMDCIIVGQPEPEVIWYHNGKPVKESDDFQLLFEGDRCTLIIKVAYLEDAGVYKCVAINSGGEASSQCHLTVEALSEAEDKSQYTQKDIILTVERPMPPNFLKTLSDTIGRVGRSAKLECQVIGEPDLSLKWFRDGHEIQPSAEFQITYDKNSGVSSLFVPEVHLSHGGTYSVTATNRAGEAQCFCTLSVPQPTVQVATQTSVIERPPTFLKYIEDNRVLRGKDAKFESIVSASPKAKVKWTFQGIPVKKEKGYKIEEDGERYFLVIPVVSNEHVGRYAVIAENDAGIATSSALLTMEEPFSQPGIWSSLQEQKAQSMIMTKKTAIIQKSTISSTTDVSDSTYQVQPSALPAISSSFTIDTSRESLIARQPTTVTKITTVQMIPEVPVTSPPRFTKPVSTAVVMEGEKLLLEGQIEGLPEPCVKWFKEDTELVNKPGMNISFSGGRASLFIMNSLEANSGKYSCVATNVAGKAISTAEVRVKPYRVAPKFTKRLQGGVVKSGAPVELEIEVSGIPNPEVKWYRNGVVLQNSPDFRITCSNASHSLTIPEAFPDDSGTFMVVATNPAGEARCIADLIVEEEKSPEEEKVITYQEISSVEKKKELFTKISLTKSGTVEPYQPTIPSDSTIKSVSEVLSQPKVPSPPPIPAVVSKVWTQSKPEMFPAPEVVEIPPPEPVPLPVFTKPTVQQEQKTKIVTTELFPKIVSKPPDKIEKPIEIVSAPSLPPEDTERSTQKPVPTIATVKPVEKEKPSDDKIVEPRIQPKFETESQKSVERSELQKFESTNTTHSSMTKQSTLVSQSSQYVKTYQTSVVSKADAVVPVPTKFIPKIGSSSFVEHDEPLIVPPVWKPGGEVEEKPSWRPVQPPSTADRIAPSISESKSFQGISRKDFQSLETTEIPTSVVTSTQTHIHSEQMTFTKKYEFSSQSSSADTTVISKGRPKSIIKKDIPAKSASPVPKTKKEVVIEEEPVVGAEVRPPLFSKVRGAESLRKIV